MKYVSEYRDAEAVRRWAIQIERLVTRPWTIMEVCGGQTHAILRHGLDQLLPKEVELLHGPGCPVCVTPVEVIDQAISVAKQKDVILCSFGDMLRVPGTQEDLLAAKAQGADVRVVYSPLDALELARTTPDKQVVFFGVGFETTAPANAMAVWQAHQQSINNFFLLSSHVLVPPAMEAVLQAPNGRVQGFLAAGHVCTVAGYQAYPALAARYQVPIVVTGFEPVDILHGLYMCLSQLEQGRSLVENQYTRSVRPEGNLAARAIVEEVFEVTEQNWRGLGLLPASGLRLKTTYAAHDASLHLAVQKAVGEPRASNLGPCLSGSVLQGLIKPHHCPHFGKTCTPESPLGATMVSNEGACAAYHRYRAPIPEVTA